MSTNISHFALNLKNLPLSFEVDALEIRELDLASDYHCTLAVRSEVAFPVTEVLQQSAMITLIGQSGNAYLHGQVTFAQERGMTPDSKAYCYKIIVHSPLYLLKLTTRPRVLLNISAVEILTLLLQQNGWATSQVNWRIEADYPKRACVIQVNESDYDFLLRQLSFWGLFFTWVQTENTYQLVITDELRRVEEIIAPTTLKYCALTGLSHPEESAWQVQQRIQYIARAVQLRDYHPEYPEASWIFEDKQRAHFDIESGGKEDRYGEHIVSPEEGKYLARLRQQALVGKGPCY